VWLLDHGNPFHEAPEEQLIVPMLFPEAIWNSVVSVATEDRGFFYVLRTSALAGPILSACVIYQFAAEMVLLQISTS
jgi:hypothetical protein